MHAVNLAEREPPTTAVDGPPRRPVAGPVLGGAVLLAGGVVAHVVDPTGGPTLCPFRAATGLLCPLCGGTRMVHRLMVGDPVGAFGLNPLAFVLLPIATWWLFVALTATAGGPTLRTPRLSARSGWVLAAVTLAFWVLRNLPVAPFRALAP
ncbi:MAG: DUF2752 domain-containing protein [Acidimicrobiia bacterium]